MDYASAVKYINDVGLLGPALGLSRVKELLARLGEPQNALRIVHVAGTNGKGSAIAMMAAILSSAGYKAGVYTSPQIAQFRENIAINSEYISGDDFARAAARVKSACEQILLSGGQHPTEFEVVTAIAFLYFAKSKCDVVLLEVGLGGRLDATNVIERPVASVLTSISLDHMDKLGSDLAQIASEKCGIIKRECPIISYYKQEDEVWRVIRRAADEKFAPLYISPKPDILKTSLAGTYFDVGEHKNLFTPLLGLHQTANASVALTVLSVLSGEGFKISESNIKEGLSKVCWAGRFELLLKNPAFVIDGAHNFAGIEAFRAGLLEYFGERPLVFIMGMLSDKEYERSLKLIAPLASRFIAVNVPNPRTLPAEKLAEIAKKYISHEKAAALPSGGPAVYTAKTVAGAVELALRLCPKDGVIAAFGSLYLMGAVKNSLRKFDFAI